MRPTVWIINQYTVTPEYPASTRHYELAKYLADDYNVVLWGSNFIHHNKSYRFNPLNLWKKEKAEGFEMLWLGAFPYKDNGVSRMLNMLGYAILLMAIGAWFGRKPDIIIGSSPSLFTAYASMFLAKIRTARFVLEVRDLWPDSLIEINHKPETSLVVKVLSWMERQLYKGADQIVALTRGIYSRVAVKTGSDRKLYYMPNGMDLKEWSEPSASDRQRIRQELNISSGEYVWMYAGAHGPANDLSQLIHCMAKLRGEPIQLVLLGEGIEKPALQKLAKELDIQKQIRFVSSVPKRDVSRWLTCADAFAICLKNTKLFEGALPNKLFDYLLHDKPIITTVRGEIEDFVVGHSVGVYGSMQGEGEHYLPQVLRNLQSGKMLSRVEGRELVFRLFDRKEQAKDFAENLSSILK
ncbi:glycosyltransferase WbuB [Paenibacillus naphthalenovorans]|nr:glycosyltransferase WbuB [Paenibacillus naphthalenovorans]